jgi:oligoendopeptidase F
MAQTVAFCFFAEALSDRNAAFKKYLAFVDGAGTKTFGELVETAGLTPPYRKGALIEPATVINDWLKDKLKGI